MHQGTVRRRRSLIVHRKGKQSALMARSRRGSRLGSRDENKSSVKRAVLKNDESGGVAGRTATNVASNA